MENERDIFNSNTVSFDDEAAARGVEIKRASFALKGGGGDGTSVGLMERVTRLETHMEYVKKDLDSIEGKLDTLLQRTAELPTKGDLTTFRWQWVATAVGAIALIVGGIIGGLGWIKPDAPAAAPQPIIIQAQPIAPPASGSPGAPKR